MKRFNLLLMLIVSIGLLATMAMAEPLPTDISVAMEECTLGCVPESTVLEVAVTPAWLYQADSIAIASYYKPAEN